MPRTAQGRWKFAFARMLSSGMCLHEWRMPSVWNVARPPSAGRVQLPDWQSKGTSPAVPSSLRMEWRMFACMRAVQLGDAGRGQLAALGTCSCYVRWDPGHGRGVNDVANRKIASSAARRGSMAHAATAMRAPKLARRLELPCQHRAGSRGGGWTGAYWLRGESINRNEPQGPRLALPMSSMSARLRGLLDHLLQPFKLADIL